MKDQHRGNTVIEAVSKLSNVVLVNLAFLITCFPVFTYGAAKTALYACSFRWASNDDAGIKDFIKAFKMNFVSGIKAGLVFLLCTVIIAADFIFSFSDKGNSVLKIISVVIILNYVPYVEQVFMCNSRFFCSTTELFSNGVLIVLGNYVKSILVGIIQAIPWIVFLINPFVFWKISAVWILIYFALSAWISALIMKKTYKQIAENHNECETEVGLQERNL